MYIDEGTNKPFKNQNQKALDSHYHIETNNNFKWTPID
jgi:hypothetical protein